MEMEIGVQKEIRSRLCNSLEYSDYSEFIKNVFYSKTSIFLICYNLYLLLFKRIKKLNVNLKLCEGYIVL